MKNQIYLGFSEMQPIFASFWGKDTTNILNLQGNIAKKK